MHIADIIALTILVIGNIYRCIRHTDTGLQTITVPLRLLAFFSVDTRPHEHLEHLLLHVLAQVVKCASGDAEEALGRRRRGRDAQVLPRHDAQRREVDLVFCPPLKASHQILSGVSKTPDTSFKTASDTIS